MHSTFIPALSLAQQATTQTDDLERDHILSQRIKLFGWVTEKHLDLPSIGENDSFIDFAKQGEHIFNQNKDNANVESRRIAQS